MSHTLRPDEPLPLANLVPPDLMHVCNGSPIVMAVFTSCAQRRTTREQALIDCVSELARAYDELLGRAIKVAQENPPPLMFKVDDNTFLEQARRISDVTLEAGTLRDKLDTAVELLKRWAIECDIVRTSAHDLPQVIEPLRENTMSFLGRVHQQWRSRGLLRQLVAKWNGSEKDPRTGGGEVDMDVLSDLADAFEHEEGSC